MYPMPTRGQPAGAASLTVGRSAATGRARIDPVATCRHRHGRATTTRRPEVTPVDDQTVAPAPDVPRLELDPTVPRRRRRRRPRRAAARPLSGLRVVALTNMVPPYKVAELERLAAEVGELQVWISTAMEADRRWEPDWGTLDVVPQRNLSVSLHRRSASMAEIGRAHV